MSSLDGIVSVKRHDGWAELILNRPERRNAIVAETVGLLSAALEDLADDDGVRAVLLRGEGGVFCSGLDLHDTPAGEDFGRAWAALHRTLAAFPVAVVGAMEKAAVAGGASLALACDLLVVGRNAFLSVPEVEMGRPAPMNVAWLSYKYGAGVALQAVLSGRRYGAEALLGAGIAHEVVPADEVRPRAEQLAALIAGFRRDTLIRLKQSVRDAAPRSFDEILDALT